MEMHFLVYESCVPVKRSVTSPHEIGTGRGLWLWAVHAVRRSGLVSGNAGLGMGLGDGESRGAAIPVLQICRLVQFCIGAEKVLFIYRRIV